MSLLLGILLGAAPSGDGFVPLDLIVESKTPLAAYQVEIIVERGSLDIVGVEGGEHPSFAKPPYYDPAALKGGRIILAAFSTAARLPSGAQRLATVHVLKSPDASYRVVVMAAADASGRSVKVDAKLIRRKVEK